MQANINLFKYICHRCLESYWWCHGHCGCTANAQSCDPSPASAIWLGRVTICRVARVVGTSPAEGWAMREMVEVAPAPAVTVFMMGADRVVATTPCCCCTIWVAGVGVVGGAAIVTVWPPAGAHAHAWFFCHIYILSCLWRESGIANLHKTPPEQVFANPNTDHFTSYHLWSPTQNTVPISIA